MFGKTVFQRIGVNHLLSEEMCNKIKLWDDMYRGNAPWLGRDQRHLALPASIASEIARMVTIEMKVNVTGSPRADYLQAQLDPVIGSLRQNVEYACALGGMVFKPFVTEDNQLVVDYIRADMVYPLEFNGGGELIDAVILEKKQSGMYIYYRAERHEPTESGYRITNTAYRSYNGFDIGTQIPLTEVKGWEDFKPEIIIPGAKRPLFAYFRIPSGNVVEPLSQVGVSVYSRAETLIQEADKQFQRLLWEFEGGELAVHVSEDLLPVDHNGRLILPEGKERLYRKVGVDAVDSDTLGHMMDVFAPGFRDVSLLNGLNDILRRIEDACGIARGTFSNPQAQARTATEIKILNQRSYSTVADTQKALEKALNDLIAAMDTLATFCKIDSNGDYETAYNWDDSIINDAEAERMQDKEDVRDGIMPKWEYRVKWYGEDEKTARKMVEDTQTDDEVMGFADAGTARPLPGGAD